MCVCIHTVGVRVCVRACTCICTDVCQSPYVTGPVKIGHVGT